MSVSMMVFATDGTLLDEVPIATTSVFKQYWVPGIEGSQLRILREWDSNCDVGMEELTVLQEEIRTIREWFSREYSGDSKYEYLMRRSGVLAQKIAEYAGDERVIELTIG